MGTCVCACGAKYRFAEASAGRSARCKQCGVTLTLQEWQEPPGGIPTPIIETNDGAVTPIIGHGPERGYGTAILWTFLFPASVHNLAAFLTLWIVFAMVESLLSALGVSSFRWGVFVFSAMIFWFAVFSWWIAFQVAVIETAAIGQFQLPNVEVSGDILVDLFEPAGRWLGSGLIAFGPTIGYAIFRANQGRNVIGDTLEALTVPQLVGVPGPVVDPVLMTLFLIGFFFWPMVVMVVVIGGFGFLWRLDLLFYSIGNTLGAYGITVLIVAACAAGWLAVQYYLTPTLAAVMRIATVGGLAQAVATRILASGIAVYVTIVAARTIGLYFRHFGHRLAWDWGQKEN